jgi:hypothetical protein
MRVPTPESKEDQNQGRSKKLNQATRKRNNGPRDAESEKKEILFNSIGSIAE